MFDIIVVVDIGIAVNVDVTNDATALWLSFPVFDKWLWLGFVGGNALSTSGHYSERFFYQIAKNKDYFQNVS